MKSYAKGLFLVLAIVPVLLAACAAKPPAEAPPEARVPSKVEPSPQELMKGKLREAEEAFEAERYTEAQRLLAAFIVSYPQSTLMDDARLLLGRLHYGRGLFREAIEELELIPKRLPPSPAYKEARYYLGLSYFSLGEKERAYPLLREELSRTEDSERRAQIGGMLAEIYLLRGENLKAISELLESVGEGVAEATRVRMRQQVASIVEKELSEEQLRSVINRYGRDFPAGIAWYSLAQKNMAAGLTAKAKEALASFLKLFPEHPLRERALSLQEELLKALQEDRGKIGVILPLSGPAAKAGEHMLQGIRFALKDQGPKVDELGIKLMAVDSRGLPQEVGDAAKAVRELVLKHKVIAIIGPLFSSPARAAAAVAHEFRVPLITPFAPRGEIATLSPWVFRNSLTNSQEARSLARYAVEKLGLRRFAVLYPEQPEGIELKELFSREVKRLGGELIAGVPYPLDASDFGPQIRRLGGMADEEIERIKKEALARGDVEQKRLPKIEYQAIFIPGYYEQAALIAPQLRFYNIVGVTLLGGRGWNSPELIRMGERSVEGALFLDGFFAGSKRPRVRSFVKSFREGIGEDPDLLAAQAYDVTTMVLKAIVEGAKTREELREALQSIRDFEGVTGRTSMDESGEAVKELFLLTVRNGKVVEVD